MKLLLRSVKVPLLTVGFVFLLAGCHTNYVKVNSVARSEAEKATVYYLEPANAALEPDSLNYKEAERFVKTALSGKGLYAAPKSEMADVVVRLDYGISGPIPPEMTRNDPVFRDRPGLSVPVQQEIGRSESGAAIYGTVNVPAAAPIQRSGEAVSRVTIITYVKYLRLTAVDNKAPASGKPPGEIWRVDVTSEGENHDLRRALPVLAAATIEFVGEDSHGQKTIELKDNDKEGPIAFVKKGM